MIGDEPTYRSPVSVGPLRQGEILSSVDQHVIQLSEQVVEASVTFRVKSHPFAVVLSQDCDLAQDFSGRASGLSSAVRQLIDDVLLCAVDLADNMKTGGSIATGSDIWKRIVQNKDDRFQYLRAVAADNDSQGAGIPPLLIDFKRAFTIPTEVLYGLLGKTIKRRTVLTSPYLEHLSSRYAYFISGVALPRDHHHS